jgi:hypothetical protein
MSTRSRRSSRKHGTVTLILVGTTAGLAAYRAGLVLAVAVTAALVILAGVLLRASRHLAALQPVTRKASQEPAVRGRRHAPGRTPPAATPASDLPDGRRVIADAAQAARDSRKRDALARSAGWLPPRKPKMLAVTQECAEGDCHLCPAPGPCEHCDHDPATIVARNQARYDRQHANGSDIPPF